MLQNIDNEVPVTVQLVAPTKEATEAAGRPTPLNPINDLLVDVSGRFMNHFTKTRFFAIRLITYR